MKIYLYTVNWSFGGVESRIFRLYQNIEDYAKKNKLDVTVELFCVNKTGRKPKNSIDIKEVQFVKATKFVELLGDLSSRDMIIQFSTGDNGFDRDAISEMTKKEKEFGEVLPEYINFFKETKALRGFYFFGHYETKNFPFFHYVIENVDFVLSAFLVTKDEQEFVIKSYNGFTKSKGEVIEYEKPIFFFNASISPAERKFGMQRLAKGYPDKNLKSVVYTGRVTFEKDIKNLVKTFLEIGKSFDRRIYGFYGNSRQMFFLKQQFPNVDILKFFKGSYSSFTDTPKILAEMNLGINLRNKVVEDHFVLENTVMEYILHGVIPIINREYVLGRMSKIPLTVFPWDKKGDTNLSHIIKDAYDRKDLSDIRRKNVAHLLRYNNGEVVVQKLFNFLKENFGKKYEV